MSHTNYSDIDLHAEREGHAIERWCDIHDEPLPLIPHVKLGYIVEEAIALGLDPHPPRNRGHFQKQNQLKAFDRIAAGKPGKLQIVTRADKLRRVRRRQERIDRVLRLAAKADRMEPLTISEATKVFDFAGRTLYTLVKLGRLPVVRTNGGPYRLEVRTLVEHFSRKFNLQQKRLQRATDARRLVA